MTSLASHSVTSPAWSPGCRSTSQLARQTQAFCERFPGLEEGADRYRLLLLVKKAGRLAGFTPRMVQLLDYYMAFTRDVDWEEGSRPVVYQSLARTALDLQITERQVQKLEQGLFQRGAITWNDSGNYKRYGQRHPVTGRLLYAFGVELTPLAQLRVRLEQLLAEKLRHDDAWMETKRQVSWYRSQIRGHLEELREEGSAEDWQGHYEEIAVAIRSSLKLPQLRDLLARHKELLNVLQAELPVRDILPEEGVLTTCPDAGKTVGATSVVEQEFAHYESTTQQSLDKSDPERPAEKCLQESPDNPMEPQRGSSSLGLEHVTVGVAVQAASERLRDLLPEEPNWQDVIAAANRLRGRLGISQTCWGDACQALGRTGAALCLLITDQACLRTEHPIAAPNAYFRTLVERGRRGELQLHRSLFGLLRKRREQGT